MLNGCWEARREYGQYVRRFPLLSIASAARVSQLRVSHGVSPPGRTSRLHLQTTTPSAILSFADRRRPPLALAPHAGEVGLIITTLKVLGRPAGLFPLLQTVPGTTVQHIVISDLSRDPRCAVGSAIRSVVRLLPPRPAVARRPPMPRLSGPILCVCST